MAISTVIVNPVRVANLASLRRGINQALRAEGWPEPSWVSTATDDTGERLARAAITQGSEVVFACGGDGTVMAVAAGLAGSEVALAVIPMGTGNLLALNLGLPGDLSAAIRVATRGSRRRIDLGEVDGQVFTVATGLGFDAQMLADTPHHAKRMLGWLAYAISILRRLGDPSFGVSIRVDQGPAMKRDVRSVLVANVGLLPGGIRLLPDALPDDGLLDVVLINPRRLWGWLSLLARLVGVQPGGSGLETFRGAAVTVDTEQIQPREADGDPLPPGTSLRAQILPGALLVCVPGPRTGRTAVTLALRAERPCLARGSWAGGRHRTRFPRGRPGQPAAELSR